MGIPALRTFWIVLKRLFQYSLKFINQFLDRCSVVRSLILRLFGLSVNFIAHFLRVMRILLPLQGDRVHEPAVSSVASLAAPLPIPRIMSSIQF